MNGPTEALPRAVPGTSRRRVLCWAGLALCGSLAGCGSDDDPGPGLYATNAQVVYRSGDNRFDYPTDVGVRVAVENTTSNRQNGTLRTTLEYVDDATATPTVLDSWTDEREVTISRGTSRAVFVVFQELFEDPVATDELRASAEFG